MVKGVHGPLTFDSLIKGTINFSRDNWEGAVDIGPGELRSRVMEEQRVHLEQLTLKEHE